MGFEDCRELSFKCVFYYVPVPETNDSVNKLLTRPLLDPPGGPRDFSCTRRQGRTEGPLLTDRD